MKSNCLKQKYSMILRLVVAVLAVLSVLCSGMSDPASVEGGSGSGIGNGVVVATIVDAGGMPVSNAKVRVRNSRYLANSSQALEKQSVGSVDSYSDASGNILITSLDSGSYTIEISSGDSIGSLRQIVVSASDTSIHLGVCSAVPYVIVNGTIFDSVASEKIIRIYGLERYINAADDGAFKIALPQGHHVLTVTESGSVDAKVLDTISTFDTLLPGHLSIMVSPSISFTEDSLIIQELLDSSGLKNFPIDSFVTVSQGRIVSLKIENHAKIVLPESFGRLSELHTLELDEVNITRLPRSVGTLRKLVKLSFENNVLHELPVEIISLVSIKECELGGNYLCTLPQPIKKWADRFSPGWEKSQKCQ